MKYRAQLQLTAEYRKLLTETVNHFIAIVYDDNGCAWGMRVDDWDKPDEEGYTMGSIEFLSPAAPLEELSKTRRPLQAGDAVTAYCLRFDNPSPEGVQYANEAGVVGIPREDDRLADR